MSHDDEPIRSEPMLFQFIVYISDGEATIAEVFSGLCPTKTQWIKIRRMLDAYYLGRTDQEIREDNVAGTSSNRDRIAASKKKKAERRLPGHVYILSSNGIYKIGRSRNLIARMKAYRTHSPNADMLLIASKLVSNAVAVEKEMHARFAGSRLRDEWFSFNNEQLQLAIGSLEAMA